MNGVCYIFAANPEGNCSGFPKINIADDDLVIAADAGLELAEKLNVIPDFAVGDFDSFDADKIKGKTKLITFPVQKDETDTHLAIKYGLEKGYKNFVILGGIGGRLDHTLANISMLYYLANRGAKGVIISAKNRIHLAYPPKFEIEAVKGFKLSVLPLFEGAEGVTLKGLKYPLINAVLNYEFPIGVSNEFRADKAEIHFTNGPLLIILSRD